MTSKAPTKATHRDQQESGNQIGEKVAEKRGQTRVKKAPKVTTAPGKAAEYGYRPVIGLRAHETLKERSGKHTWTTQKIKKRRGR